MANNTIEQAAINAAFGALPDQILENPILSALGPLALYNNALINVSTCLFMHGAVFGILLTLRRFDLKKVCDFRYLSFALSLSLIIAPAVFLFDTNLDFLKLYFFLEHEALEILIFCVTFLSPAFMDLHRGKVLMALWTTISFISIMMALQDQIKHAADLVAWGAFTSDSLLAIQGIICVLRWRKGRPGASWKYALAGFGHACHGITTLGVPPVFAGIIYSKWDPVSFAWAWFAVFVGAFATISCGVPLTAEWAAELRWNCAGPRPQKELVLPQTLPLRTLDRKPSFHVDSPYSINTNSTPTSGKLRAPPAYIQRKGSLGTLVDLPPRTRSDSFASLASINQSVYRNEAWETLELSALYHK